MPGGIAHPPDSYLSRQQYGQLLHQRQHRLDRYTWNIVSLAL